MSGWLFERLLSSTGICFFLLPFLVLVHTRRLNEILLRFGLLSPADFAGTSAISLDML